MNGPPQSRYKVKDIFKDGYFRRWLPKWHINVMENYPQIKKDFQVDSNLKAHKDCCISNVSGAANRPALIIGSGPSLDKVAPLLKKWQHPIFTPTSCATVPVRWGRDPEYVAAYDSHWSLLGHIKGHKWEKSTLLVHPYAEPKLIKWWKWEKLYFRRHYPNMEFSEIILPMMFPWIKVGIKVTGNVTNNLITIADYWGYSPIFLMGVDLGWYDDDYNRATFYTPEKDGNWLPVPPKKKSEWGRIPEIFQFGDIKTKEMFMIFKFQMCQMWKSRRMHIINCTGGLLSELPNADGEEVVKKQGYGFEGLKKDDKEISLIVDDFAARFVAFNKELQRRKKEKKNETSAC